MCKLISTHSREIENYTNGQDGLIYFYENKVAQLRESLSLFAGIVRIGC